MRRTHIVLLPAFLMLGAVSCGGGGQGGSGPPGGFTHENGGRPVANGWDPFAPATDPAPSSTEFPGCSGDQTITASQVIDTILLPICDMAVTCGGMSTTPPTPDNPQPATPGGASNGGTSTRDVSSDLPPTYCESIYAAADPNLVDNGFAGICELFQLMSDALKAHPECNPPIEVPRGLCLDALSTCINDIVAAGCNGLEAEPSSCSGLSFGSSDSSGTGGSGGGGGGGGAGGSGGTQMDPCSQCMSDCNGDSDCMTACFTTGPCAQ